MSFSWTILCIVLLPFALLAAALGVGVFFLVRHLRRRSVARGIDRMKIDDL